MDYEEIVCVYLNLKFLIFKNTEKNEDCLSNNFSVHLADTNDIEVGNKSKEYFIKKLHRLLKKKKKKKNEYECVLNGTVTEVANFLFQHIQLLIEIEKEENGEEHEDNIHRSFNNNGQYKNRERFDGAIGKHKIHLLKNIDMEDTSFENNKIYFKCLFSDLITDFEFLENKKYENISNFSIAEDLVFSICVKLEEYLIEKKDVEKMKYSNNVNMNKYDFRFRHILSIFELKNFFYINFNFNNYKEQFFCDNKVEITVGEMLQNVSDKMRKNRSDYVNNNDVNRNSNVENETIYFNENRNLPMRIANEFNIGCHFSLILIENVEELYHYFFINDVYININNQQLNLDKAIFTNIDEENENWIRSDHFKQITFTVDPFYSSTKNGINNNLNTRLQFEICFICIFLNPPLNRADIKLNSISNVGSLSRDYFNYLENNNNCVNTFPYPHPQLPVSVPGNNNGEYRINNENYSRNSKYTTNQFPNRGMSGELSFNNINLGTSENRKPVITKNDNNLINEIHTQTEYNNCNFFLSVNKCHILELSNIYAEKKKKVKNNFFVKIVSDLFHQNFISPMYLFEEDSIIALKNCYVSADFQLGEGKDLYSIFVDKVIFFDLCLKEEDNEVNIGKGELKLTEIANELSKLIQEEDERGQVQGHRHGYYGYETKQKPGQQKRNNYFKFSQNVFIFLNVFKEKFLTAELSLEIFFRLTENKIMNSSLGNAEVTNYIDMYGGNNRMQSVKEIRELKERTNEVNATANISRVEVTNFKNKIPSNIYEFKMWKEEEEEKMKLLLKKKEESLIKKFLKKFEIFEKERKSEYEMKKNELKEMMIQIKEEQLNVINKNNLIILKEKELNEEIHLLDSKLKKIKYAYEKSLYKFKENLRKTNLNESIIQENNQLRETYKLIVTEKKQLENENEEMANILKKYNNKDNVIISSKYFEKLKEELKHLKECKMNMLTTMKKELKEKEKDGETVRENEGLKHNNLKDNDEIQHFLRTIHYNRTKYLKYIVNLITHLEELYDLANEETLEDNFQIMLTEINAMKTLINKELKEEKIIMEICAPLLSYENEINENIETHGDIFKNIDENFIKQKERCLTFHKTVGIKQNDKKGRKKEKEQEKGKDIYKKNEKRGSLKSLDKEEGPKDKLERGKLNCIAKKDYKGKGNSLLYNDNEMSKGLKAKKEENDRIIENLRSEIKRLVQSGIYNEDDEIIKRMKQKLVALMK